MLKYKLHQDDRGTTQDKGNWYARTVVDRIFGLNEQDGHMANHNSPYSLGDVQAVLTGKVKSLGLKLINSLNHKKCLSSLLSNIFSLLPPMKKNGFSFCVSIFFVTFVASLNLFYYLII